jgi:hypothetical protein
MWLKASFSFAFQFRFRWWWKKALRECELPPPQQPSRVGTCADAGTLVIRPLPATASIPVARIVFLGMVSSFSDGAMALIYRHSDTHLECRVDVYSPTLSRQYSSQVKMVFFSI